MVWIGYAKGIIIIILKFNNNYDLIIYFYIYSYNTVLARQLVQYYGNITVENAIRYITPIVQTGSLIVSYYDYTRNLVYTANARGILNIY